MFRMCVVRFGVIGHEVDDWRMHLVVLPLAEPFSKIQNPAATKTALEMLSNRSDQPRLKPNRMLFLAADFEAAPRLDDLICSFKAWSSIVLDFDNGGLNLDRPQSTQARDSRVNAPDAANRAIREAYKWLLAPTEETLIRAKRLVNDAPDNC